MNAPGFAAIRSPAPDNWPEVEYADDPLIVKLREGVETGRWISIGSGSPTGMTFPAISRRDPPHSNQSFTIRDDPKPEAPLPKSKPLTPEQRERYAENTRRRKEQERVESCHLRWFRALCHRATQPEFQAAEANFWDWIWQLMKFWSADGKEQEIDAILSDPALLKQFRKRIIAMWNTASDQPLTDER
jgi:hypothetical protein